jgi:hypothetical protein
VLVIIILHPFVLYSFSAFRCFIVLIRKLVEKRCYRMFLSIHNRAYRKDIKCECRDYL